jgi:hypothetical protein
MSFIPHDSVIYRMLVDIRDWRAKESDWRRAREWLEELYGYDKYGGNCHMVPNHGVIALALAYGGDDFQRALTIVNTCGWDTDCNSGNVGCLMGIRLGLPGIDGSPVDWRGPVADRMYLPTADGGRSVTDAAQETYRICRTGRALMGQSSSLPGAYPTERFHFELPGSLQGFQAEGEGVRLENVPKHSAMGQRSLAIRLPGGAEPARAFTATFIPPEALKMPGYGLIASPTLYPGQTLHASLSADCDARVSLFVRAYGAGDALVLHHSQPVTLRGGVITTLGWELQGLDGGSPIAQVGVQAECGQAGTLHLDYLTWSGAPDTVFKPPPHDGTLWQRAWIKGCSDAGFGWGWAMRACQDAGTGLLMQGEREWSNYTVRATVTPHLARAAGIAACAQGMQRYYALLLCDDGQVRLVKQLDGRQTLADAAFDWRVDGAYTLSLTTRGDHLAAAIDGRPLFEVRDTHHPLLSGAVALAIEEGRLDCDEVAVSPA